MTNKKSSNNKNKTEYEKFSASTLQTQQFTQSRSLSSAVISQAWLSIDKYRG
jgi:hypothetical protein